MFINVLRLTPLGLAAAVSLLLAGCAINPVPPGNLPPKPSPPIPKSRIAASLKTNWPSLVARVDETIPRCHGNFQGDDNSTCLGTEQSGHFIIQREEAKEYFSPGDTVWFQGSVWRWNPVGMSISNGHLEAGLKTLYHVRIGWDPFGSVGSCGYGQPARFLYVGFRGPVQLNPGWFVDPNLSTYAQNDPGRPCRVTMFNFNATGIIEGAVNRVLDGAKNKAQDRIREKTNYRNRAFEVWSALNQPIKIGDRIWLTINPERAFAGPLSVIGSDLTLPVALEAAPRIVAGGKPAPGKTPLPNLVSGPLDPAFNINLHAAVSFAELERRLRAEFLDRTFTLGTRWPLSQMTFQIADVQVGGSGDQIVVAARVEGFAKGTLYFFGTPAFIPGQDRLQGKIVVQNVDYSVETRNILVHLGNIIFHNRLQDQIQRAAQWDVSRQLMSGYNSLNAAMNRNLSPEARLEGRITTFGPGRIWTGRSGVEAFYPVGGELAVIVAPL